MKKETRSNIIFYSIILIFLALIFIFSYLAYSQYHVLRTHGAYFRQGNNTIQPWMTIRSVERHFNISSEIVNKELKIKSNLTYYNPNTIQSICIKNKLNCTKVVEDLNNLLKP